MGSSIHPPDGLPSRPTQLQNVDRSADGRTGVVRRVYEVSVPEAGCWPEAFLASLKKIELTADRHGNVNVPRLLLPAETGEKVRAELESYGPAYQDKGETLLRQKANEARRKNSSASRITRVSTTVMSKILLLARRTLSS